MAFPHGVPSPFRRSVGVGEIISGPAHAYLQLGCLHALLPIACAPSVSSAVRSFSHGACCASWALRASTSSTAGCSASTCCIWPAIIAVSQWRLPWVSGCCTLWRPLPLLPRGVPFSARALAPFVHVPRPLLGRISAPRRAGHFPGCRLAPLLLTGPCRYFRSVGRTTLCENQPVATVARSADSCSRGPQRGLSEVIHRYHAALSLSVECLYVDSQTGNHPAVGRITTSPYILTHHPRGASGTA